MLNLYGCVALDYVHSMETHGSPYNFYSTAVKCGAFRIVNEDCQQFATITSTEFLEYNGCKISTNILKGPICFD